MFQNSFIQVFYIYCKKIIYSLIARAGDVGQIFLREAGIVTFECKKLRHWL